LSSRLNNSIMRNRDQILLESLYLSMLEEESKKPVMEKPESLIGQVVQVHPAISGTPETEEYFMAWSVKVYVPEVKKWMVRHSAKTLLLKDCKATIEHDKVAGYQLDPSKGQKTPNLLVTGTVVDVSFDMNEIPSILSKGDWSPVTFNPHKHSEYVYKDKLPEWWNTDERFPHDNRRSPNMISDRLKGSDERRKEGFEYNELSKRISENLSKFECDYILLKQYLKRGEDYMWVRGVK
jgi:hypothetical protein